MSLKTGPAWGLLGGWNLALVAIAGAAPAPSGAARTVRVQIVPQAPVVKVSGMDLRLNDRLIKKALSGSTRWELRCAKGHAIFMPALDSTASATTAPSKPFHRPLPVTLESLAGFVSVDGRRYRDRIELRAQDGGCQVINEVDLEKYLAGIVNTEFSSKWSDESIRAQIVAARTYAVVRIEDARRRGRVWDVDSTVRDQVYDGAQVEDARSVRLTESTRGMVLTASGSRGRTPIKAYYHSTCGGHTELPEKVWGRAEPGFRSRVKCGFCNDSPRYSWESDFGREEMAKALRSALKVERGAELVAVQAGASAQPSGRVADVITTWRAHGEKQLRLPAGKFREALGAERVRSTSFSVAVGPHGGFKVEGRGFGHGVGMCQWGAKVMGERGYSMETILSRYYPDAELTRRW